MIKKTKTIIKQIAGSLFSSLVSTSRGKAFIINALNDHPQLCIEAFGKKVSLSERFENISHWPDNIDKFEDLVFLFSCTQLNMGIATLALDEAAYLYKTIKGLKSARLVEIGRFKGGGTFLMAAAMDMNSQLRSYDIHVKMKSHFDGEAMDKILDQSLKRYGLDDRVSIIVGDSGQVDIGIALVDLIFIDGDHTYEGVKKDFVHWYKAVRPGGHLLFHDCAKTREFTTYHEEVDRFVREMEERFGQYFQKVGEAGSIAHFVRNQLPLEVK